MILGTVLRYAILPFVGLAFIMLLFTGGDMASAGRMVSNAYHTTGAAMGITKGGFPEAVKGFKQGANAAEREAAAQRREDAGNDGNERQNRRQGERDRNRT